jgi:hypothetical protein
VVDEMTDRLEVVQVFRICIVEHPELTRTGGDECQGALSGFLVGSTGSECSRRIQHRG